MSEVLGVLGSIQENGGVMLMLGYLVWTMRQHRDDFKNHAHDSSGKPYVKKRASEL
jgi:hypothetical protein